MTVKLSIVAGAAAQFFDNNGDPLSGGKLFTYAAGTTTFATTYTSSSGAVAHTNPIILDAAGRISSGGEIWLTDGVEYKFVLKTSNDVLIGTYDNITSADTNTLGALAASNGSSLVGYINGLAGTVATTVQTALRRTVWVEDFLPANFNYATDDAQPYIQAAISSGAREVMFDAKTYRIRSPIYVDGNISLIGKGGCSFTTVITKVTTTIGTGTNLSRSGAFTDSYAQNAILIFRHADNSYTYNTTIKGISLLSDGYIVEYGIYAPRVSSTILEDVDISYCRIGWFTYDGWFNNFSKVIINAVTRRGINGGPTFGWPTTTYGFWWQGDGIGGTGTALNADTCWARDCDIGWNLIGLKYSTLNGCGADNISNMAYYFSLAQISMNGCGLENVQITGPGACYFEFSQVTMNSCTSSQIFGSSAANTAFMFIVGGQISLNSTVFSNFSVPNASFNLALQNGGLLTLNNSSLPSNGNTFVSYTNNAQSLNLNSSPPSLLSSASNKNTRYIMGRVRDNQVQETVNKAIASGGTTIATFTAQATALVETAVCRFTVSWSDTSFPSAAGISTFLVTVYVANAGVNYDQNISTVTSAAAGNTGGVVTAPTFAFSRVGPVWSLTMTPAHGACTAHTITAEMQNIAGITLALP